MPFTINQTKADTLTRLLRYRSINDVTGCWLWTGSVMPNGYGVISMRLRDQNSNRLVHRTSAWVFKRFDIFSDLNVLHRCDIRHCFNPDHLFLGTQLDNMKDAWVKGRLNCELQRHPRKLNASQVKSIRTIYAKGGHTNRSLAIELGLGKSTIQAIIAKKLWGHV